MGSRSVALDITRLVTRFSRTTPNGIDRIDLAFARRYLVENPGDNCGVILLPGSPRVLPARDAAPLIEALEALWGEADEARAATQIARIGAALAMNPAPRLLHLGEDRPWWKRGPNFARTVGAMLRTSGLSKLPQGAAYLNVSQFPVWRAASYAWMDARPDVRALFMLHDVIPLDYPEFFPGYEFDIHAGRLATLSARASGVLASSRYVSETIERAWRMRGLPAKPLHVAPFFADAVFTRAHPRAEPLFKEKVFVACGTLEPRKNFLRLLQVWRVLAQELGADCPRLIIIGALGWSYDQAYDLLTRSEKLDGKVTLVTGLTSLAVARLYREAAALLSPSFVEGFGLPVMEATAAGLPVIASTTTPALDELAITPLARLDPIDGEAWRRAIASPPANRAAPAALRDRDAYFDDIDAVIRGLD